MSQTSEKKPNMTVKIAGITMRNPVINAAGTMGYGEEFADFVNVDDMGAFIPKGLTIEPRKGNEPPRIMETSCGILNNIGLQNIGVKAFISQKLPYLRQFDTPIIVNINSSDDFTGYKECALQFNNVEGVAGLEINVSCPNVQQGGAQIGKKKEKVYWLVKLIKDVTNLPLIVKLTPDVTDITEIVKAAEDGGADAISLINTTKGAAIIDGKLFVGGLSGPAIKPRALYLVSEAVNAVKTPVIGMGGIMTAEDALDFLGVGAQAVAVGTANFYDKQAIPKIIKGIHDFMAENNIADINDFIGSYR